MTKKNLPAQQLGYWPSIFGHDGQILAEFCFFCLLMDLESVSVHKLAKKVRGQFLDEAYSGTFRREIVQANASLGELRRDKEKLSSPINCELRRVKVR